MKCANCHKDKITIAILEPNTKHERRLCWDCILNLIHREWRKEKEGDRKQ